MGGLAFRLGGEYTLPPIWTWVPLLMPLTIGPGK
jgi:hypothetical protein